MDKVSTAFNYIYLICGVGAVVVLIFALKSIAPLRETYDEMLALPTILFIVSTVFMITVGALGVTGNHLRSFIIIVIFGVAVLLTSALFIVSGALAMGEIESIKPKFLEKIKSMFVVYNDTHELDSFDEYQSKMDCCGVDSYTDWYMPGLENHYYNLLPVSCCQMTASADTGDLMDPICINGFGKHYLSLTGCYTKSTEQIDKSTNLFIYGAFAFGAFGIIVAAIAFAVSPKYLNMDGESDEDDDEVEGED